MIITKKAYNEAIAKVKEEMCRQFEAHDKDRQQRHWTEDKFCAIHKRMDAAFGDIDRRLTALEKAKAEQRSDAVCVSRY